MAALRKGSVVSIESINSNSRKGSIASLESLPRMHKPSSESPPDPSRDRPDYYVRRGSATYHVFPNHPMVKDPAVAAGPGVRKK